MTAATLFPTQRHDVLEVSGPDAARFLHNYCTSSINELADGAGHETFFPSDKGRILAYGRVDRVGDRYLVHGAAGLVATLAPHLGKYALLENVTLADVSDSWAHLLLTGGDAQAVTGDVVGGSEHAVVRDSWDVVGGAVCLLCPMEDVDAVRHGFLSAGVTEGVAEEAEYRRIEAGVPIVGQDVSDKNLVQEAARTHLAVSFTKGCYLGQEPIARLDAMGHTNRELRTLRLETVAQCTPGTDVILGDKSVGTISSVATWDGQTVALAVVRKSACEPGTIVTVDGLNAMIAWSPRAMSLDN